MRRVTVRLDERAARWARIEAAKRDMSVSALIRELLGEKMRRETSPLRLGPNELTRC